MFYDMVFLKGSNQGGWEGGGRASEAGEPCLPLAPQMTLLRS